MLKLTVLQPSRAPVDAARNWYHSSKPSAFVLVGSDCRGITVSFQSTLEQLALPQYETLTGLAVSFRIRKANPPEVGSGLQADAIITTALQPSTICLWMCLTPLLKVTTAVRMDPRQVDLGPTEEAEAAVGPGVPGRHVATHALISDGLAFPTVDPRVGMQSNHSVPLSG